MICQLILGIDPFQKIIYSPLLIYPIRWRLWSRDLSARSGCDGVIAAQDQSPKNPKFPILPPNHQI